jgi:FtsZ-binding cell division protein ZapB
LSLENLEIFESRINQAVEAINRLKEEKGQLVQTVNQLEAKASELEKEKAQLDQKLNQLLLERGEIEEEFKKKEKRIKRKIEAILNRLSVLSDG